MLQYAAVRGTPPDCGGYTMRGGCAVRAWGARERGRVRVLAAMHTVIHT